MAEPFTMFTNDIRKQNVEKLFGQLEGTDLDFNSVIFAFADVIQSTFLNSMMNGKSDEEQEEMNQQISDSLNDVIRLLEEQENVQAVDMVVLCNLMMDAAEGAASLANRAEQNE